MMSNVLQCSFCQQTPVKIAANQAAYQTEYENLRISATLDLIRIQSEFSGSMKEIIYSSEEQLETRKMEARSTLLKVPPHTLMSSSYIEY